jgi:hypothetical protein
MRADIHDGQERERSTQGPDTEAQDQQSPDHHSGLQRTAGPYRCANSRPEQVQQRAWRLTTLFVLLARADEGSSSRSCGKPFEDSPRRAIG